MKVFFAFFKQGFKSNSIYKADYFLGILSACIQIFITVAIWRALYAGADSMDGISFRMLTTNFVLSIGLSYVFSFNDYAVQGKLYDGTIAMELLRPMDYRVGLLANDIGTICFKLITNFVPIFLIAIVGIGINGPVDLSSFLLFLFSVLLGFFILLGLSYIVKMTTFWIMNVWSVSVLKGVFISVFSGITLPLWFMPKSVLRVIQFTPLDSIYFNPIQLYFNQMNADEIMFCFLKQIIWIVILFAIGNMMWHYGRKRIVVQGG